MKRVVQVLISLFLAWQSWRLLVALLEVSPEHWGVMLFVAWVVNMMITGVFAFAVFALPVERLLPDGYYRISHPERLLAIYRRLGVEGFRRVLLATLWRSPSKRDSYFDGTADGLRHLGTKARKSEFGHAVSFVLLCVVSVVFAATGALALGLLTFGINVLGNLYPVLLQRHHRLRLQRLQARYGVTTGIKT